MQTALVCSVGGGADYVGPCINIAARLQKLGSLSFCILQRGMNFDTNPAPLASISLVRKKTFIRGIGEELVYVVDEEFDRLSEEEKENFREPAKEKQ